MFLTATAATAAATAATTTATAATATTTIAATATATTATTTAATAAAFSHVSQSFVPMLSIPLAPFVDSDHIFLVVEFETVNQFQLYRYTFWNHASIQWEMLSEIITQVDVCTSNLHA
jgi:hypothetical protein